MFRQRPPIFDQIDRGLTHAPSTTGFHSTDIAHYKVAGVVAMRGVQELEKRVSKLEALVDDYRQKARVNAQQVRTLEARINKITSGA